MKVKGRRWKGEVLRKRVVFYFILIQFIINFELSTNLFASFSEFLNDARNDALAGSFRIYNFDSRGIFLNPASISNIENKSLFFNYSPGYISLKDVKMGFNSFSFNSRFKKIPFAIGYKLLDVSSQYKEDKFVFSVAKEFFYFDFGINLNLLKIGFVLDERTSIDPLFSSKKNSSAFSLDLGIIRKFEKVSFSLFFSNLNSPSIGIKQKEKVPVEMVLTFGKEFYLFNNKIIVETGFYKRKEEENIKLGLDFGMRRFNIRAGFDNNRISLGIGFKGYRKLIFDYAVLYPFDLAEILHEISVGVKF